MVLGFALVRLANPYMQGYKYEQLVQREVNSARPRAEAGAVHRRVLEEGRAMGFVLSDEDVQVERLVRGYHVRVHYAVPVDFIVYRSKVGFDFVARTGDTELSDAW